MLTMFIKTYFANVAVNIKPTYLNKHVFSQIYIVNFNVIIINRLKIIGFL